MLFQILVILRVKFLSKFETGTNIVIKTPEKTNRAIHTTINSVGTIGPLLRLAP